MSEPITNSIEIEAAAATGTYAGAYATMRERGGPNTLNDRLRASRNSFRRDGKDSIFTRKSASVVPSSVSVIDPAAPAPSPKSISPRFVESCFRTRTQRVDQVPLCLEGRGLMHSRARLDLRPVSSHLKSHAGSKPTLDVSTRATRPRSDQPAGRGTWGVAARQMHAARAL